MSFLLKFVQTNALLSIPSTGALQNATRSFASRLSTTQVADIEKKLGFPEKPKRPLAPFIRFSSALRPTLKDLGNRKATDIVIELGALWRNADDAQKAIYKKQFETDMVKYNKELEAYKCRITDEQAAQLKSELASLKKSEAAKREKKKQTAVAEALGKPKHPLSAYLLFVKDLRSRSPAKLSLTEVAAKWQALSDEERKVYTDKADKSAEKYHQALQQWEEKMVKDGHVGLVRTRQVPNAPKKKAAPAKPKVATSKPKDTTSKPKKTE